MNAQDRVENFFSQQENVSKFKQYTPKQKEISNDIIEKKVCSDIDDAIKRCGIKDGMTISFHHAFRNGDFVVNMVMDRLASLGYKNLTLASSSLTYCHAPLVKHIENGVISKIYTSGLRGELATRISKGLMDEPVQIHSHGGRVHLLQTGELKIDVAFLGVYKSDKYGNSTGRGFCGSLGYAMADAEYADKVVILTQEFEEYPLSPASIKQDQVDYVVQVDKVGDPTKIGAGATRITSNPRELLIAQKTADIITKSPYFKDGFSMQTGSGGAALAVTRFLREKMQKDDIKASFALGGITKSMVELLEQGFIKKLLDTQSFDHDAALSLEYNPMHIEISSNQYANYSSKGASVNLLDFVILSALEIDTSFNVNVITGSDGEIRGASGGHCDTAASAQMVIVVAPLVRGRIPTVVDNVITCITPGIDVDILVTDHGIAINPIRTDLIEHFKKENIKTFSIEELKERAYGITGVPKPIEFTDKKIAIVRYRDGSVIDIINQLKN